MQFRAQKDILLHQTPSSVQWVGMLSIGAKFENTDLSYRTTLAKSSELACTYLGPTVDFQVPLILKLPRLLWGV